MESKYRLLGFNSKESLIGTIKETMRTHIGYENSILVIELMEKIIGKKVKTMNIYEKTFYFTFIRAVISKLRNDLTIFIVFEGNQVYVLKSEDEVIKYHNRMDRMIDGCNHRKKLASQWVKQELWKKI